MQKNNEINNSRCFFKYSNHNSKPKARFLSRISGFVAELKQTQPLVERFLLPFFVQYTAFSHLQQLTCKHGIFKRHAQVTHRANRNAMKLVFKIPFFNKNPILRIISVICNITKCLGLLWFFYKKARARPENPNPRPKALLLQGTFPTAPN